MIDELSIWVRWWLVLLALGAAATPLAWRLFGHLPSRGYALAKPLGLLLAAWPFWLLNSFGFLRNDRGGMLLAGALVVAAGVWAQRRRAQTLRATLRSEWRTIVAVELLFVLLFAGWAWLRAQNPAILNTEKPMEFAFLNAVGRSATFPPLDPWLSGYAISYYYFGYVMTSFVTRLAAVPAAYGFNLAIAWLYAATSIGVAALVYDLVALHGAFGARARRLGATLALVGMLAVTTAGNLQIVLEVAHANGVGSAAFWRWLDIRDINEPPDADAAPRYTTAGWWWWRASRVIHEQHLSGRSETGLEPIAEFPSFSFALGDVHPHVLALPYAVLSITLALVWYLRPVYPTLSAGDALRRLLRDRLAWLTAIVLGGLAFLNTWDVLIHLFLIVGAQTLAAWRARGGWDSTLFWRALALFAGFALAAVALYLPFYIGFSSQAGPPFILPMLMRPTRLAQFGVIFGLPLLVIVALLAALLWQARRAAPQRLATALRAGLLSAGALVGGLFLLLLVMSWIVFSAPDGAARASALAQELGIALPPLAVGSAVAANLLWAAGALLRLLPALLLARLTTPGVTLLLATLVGAAVALANLRLYQPTPRDPRADERPRDMLPFVLLLILTGALLTLGPEFVYLKDNFGQRLNTIFKFYYQAWLLFGIAAAVGLALLLARARVIGVLIGGVYTLLLAGALLFPYYMARWGGLWYSQPPTLNGLAFMQANQPDELDALRWLAAQPGNPVVLEAVGGQYSDFARVSARTGLPTLLGWPGHQYQWRGSTPEPAAREPVVATIYSQPTWDGIAALLDRYDVRYIYVGALERTQYGTQGLAKFDANLRVVYQNSGVTIYAWEPALGAPAAR